MTTLFSCLYGSKLYGTSTPESDLDLKKIYLPELNDMLIGRQLANKVKKTNNAKNTRNDANDVDEELIPIQVFARDFLEGQTYALELAFAMSSSEATLYLDDLFERFCNELRTKFLTSNIKSMMGYVVNQASIYSFKGERLNAAREVLEVLIELSLTDKDARLGLTDDDPRWERWAALTLKYPKYFKLTEYDIGDGQMRPCFMILEKTLPFTNSMEMSVKVVKNLVDKYGSRADAASAENVDWKAMMHALRILEEGAELLSPPHTLQFPFKPDVVSRFLSIKRGEVDLEIVKDELDRKLNLLKQLEMTTNLPKLTPELRSKFDAWLAEWMRIFYEI